MSKTVFEVLDEELKAKVDLLQDALCEGTIATMEDFRYVRGQLRGLLVAQDLIKALAKNFEEN